LERARLDELAVELVLAYTMDDTGVLAAMEGLVLHLHGNPSQNCTLPTLTLDYIFCVLRFVDMVSRSTIAFPV
jgi:hypothetical protein